MSWKTGVPDTQTGLVLKMMPGQIPYTEQELSLLFGLVNDAAIVDVDEESEFYAMCEFFEQEENRTNSERIMAMVS